MATTAQRAQAIINSLQNQKSGYVWLEYCKSPTAFMRTWVLGRAGRKLALLAAKDKKTAGKGAAAGYVVARHALVALQKLARKAKSRGGQLIAEFLHFVLVLGLWAARAVASIVEVPIRLKKQNLRQVALPVSMFGG